MTTGNWEDLNMWDEEGVGTPATHYPNTGVTDDAPQIYTAGTTLNINTGTMDAWGGVYQRLGLGLGEGGAHPLGPATINVATGAKLEIQHWMIGEHYDSTKYGPLRKASYMAVNIGGQVEATGRISMWNGYNKITVNDGGNLHTGGYLDLKDQYERCLHVSPEHDAEYSIIDVMAGGSYTMTGDGAKYSGVMWNVNPDGTKSGRNAIKLHGTAEFVITTDYAQQVSDGSLPGAWDDWRQLLEDMANGGGQSGGDPSVYEGSVFVTYADDSEDTEVDAYVFQRGDSWVVSAVPEPATIALLGFGVLALIRKKR